MYAVEKCHFSEFTWTTCPMIYVLYTHGTLGTSDLTPDGDLINWVGALSLSSI